VSSPTRRVVSCPLGAVATPVVADVVEHRVRAVGQQEAVAVAELGEFAADRREDGGRRRRRAAERRIAREAQGAVVGVVHEAPRERPRAVGADDDVARARGPVLEGHGAVRDRRHAAAPADDARRQDALEARRERAVAHARVGEGLAREPRAGRRPLLDVPHGSQREAVRGAEPLERGQRRVVERDARAGAERVGPLEDGDVADAGRAQARGAGEASDGAADDRDAQARDTRRRRRRPQRRQRGEDLLRRAARVEEVLGHGRGAAAAVCEAARVRQHAGVGSEIIRTRQRATS